mmetsp:Transcript_67830/g.126714  ORF Transcript_67830/g.126714 Transcript_67830/m.126714 type:complete len:357 (-) Transcript_67830:49-1119(-)
MPLYEEKFICPFAIRFSQARIRPTFQDGRVVEKTKDQIRIVPWPLADGDYDILLDAPFPPIEIMRWRPKYRSEDGSAFETGRGDAVLADSCWCTFDNRRLYCLQAAAVEQWPRRAAAVVHVMHNLPEGRSVLRKFRTTDLGTSVKISRRNDSVPRSVWHWPDLAVGASAPRSLEERRAVDRAAVDAAKESWEELVDVPSTALPSSAAARAARAAQAAMSTMSSALERFELAETMATCDRDRLDSYYLDNTEDSTTVTTTASGSGSPAMVHSKAGLDPYWQDDLKKSSAAAGGGSIINPQSSQQQLLQQNPKRTTSDGWSPGALHPTVRGATAGLGVFVSDEALFEADEDDTGCEQQ